MKRLLKRQRFLPSRFGAVFNPVYLIRRDLYKAIRPAAQQIKGDVLDFGCGSKPYRELFSNCASYTGVDIRSSGHDHSDSEIDIFYDGETLPFPDKNFDAVISFETFEHVFDIDAILAEIHRVMKPGGEILITLPFAWPEHEQPFDFARYTSFGIRSILEKSGFSVSSIEKSNGAVRAIHQIWIEYIVSTLFGPLGLAGKVLRIPFVCVANAIAITLAAVLPKNDTYFSNLIVRGLRVDKPAVDPLPRPDRIDR